MKYAALLISFLLCIEYWSQNVEGAHCSTSSGRKEECQPITSCATLPENLILTICDFSHTVPFICCPVPFDDDVKPDVTNSVCGLRPKTSELLRVERHVQSIEPVSLVVNGNDSAPHSWPWIVSVHIKFDMFTEKYCGGTIISERYVLSAAHCFANTDDRSRNIVINVGGHSRTDGVRYSIEEIKNHPLYIYGKNNYDIALLKIKGVFRFNETISPACLPSAGEDYTNEMATVIGWGRTSSSLHSRVLQEVKVPVLSDTLCQIFGLRWRNISTDDVLCAGSLEGGKDACEGDSGGPLLYQDHASLKWTVIGITSFGEGCGRPLKPGVYTKVSSYLPWIIQNMGH